MCGLDGQIAETAAGEWGVGVAISLNGMQYTQLGTALFDSLEREGEVRGRAHNSAIGNRLPKRRNRGSSLGA